MRQWLMMLLLILPCWLSAQEPPNGRDPRGPRPRIELAADDKPAFAAPAPGWDQPKPGIPRGKLEMVEYDSKTVGTRRRMNVYTPPGYDQDKDATYPVLYLLHGIGGDETEWARFAQPDTLLDNLVDAGKAERMIVVMPNGRAQKDDRPVGDVFKHAPAFAAFERDLLDDVIPFIESKYRARPNRENRALAGLSMGGGQSLNFGFAHADTFAWVGGFSSAPNTRRPEELLPDAALAGRYRLIWLSCGNRDGLLHISQGVHRRLDELKTPHVWHVTDHAHDAAEWKQALYHFAQQLKFTPGKEPSSL